MFNSVTHVPKPAIVRKRSNDKKFFHMVQYTQLDHCWIVSWGLNKVFSDCFVNFWSYLIWFLDDVRIQYSSDFKICLVFSKAHGIGRTHSLSSNRITLLWSKRICVEFPWNCPSAGPRGNNQDPGWGHLRRFSRRRPKLGRFFRLCPVMWTLVYKP